MPTLEATPREHKGKKVQKLRDQGRVPGIIYGPEIKNIPLSVDAKTFGAIYQEAGESSLITLKVEKKEFPVLIQDIKRDPVTGDVLHVDFYQPILTKEVEATVPLVFEGEAPAVKDLGGTLVKDIQEVDVKALPQNLPHQIVVKVDTLHTFDDEILIKDLAVPEGVKLLREPEEVVANVVPAEKVEEELEKPIEEKVEEVEGAEEEKPEAEGEGEAPAEDAVEPTAEKEESKEQSADKKKE